MTFFSTSVALVRPTLIESEVIMSPLILVGTRRERTQGPILASTNRLGSLEGTHVNLELRRSQPFLFWAIQGLALKVIISHRP